VITEQTEDRKNRLMVFEDKAEAFMSVLQEAVGKMKEVK